MKKLSLSGAALLVALPIAAQNPSPNSPGNGQPPRPNPIVNPRPLDDAGPDAARLQRPTVGPAPDHRPAAPSSSSSARRPSDGDGASVDAVLAALYASVSHDEASRPDWERMRNLFLQVGMLIPPKNPRSDMFTVLDVDGFEQRVREGIASAKQKGDPTSFFEKEIFRRTDCFGNVCQIFSTYESRRAPTDEKPFVRGINSIQLVYVGRRWWIASVAWDQERPDNPIPAQYLPNTVPSEYLKKN